MHKRSYTSGPGRSGHYQTPLNSTEIKKSEGEPRARKSDITMEIEIETKYIAHGIVVSLIGR